MSILMTNGMLRYKIQMFDLFLCKFLLFLYFKVLRSRKPCDILTQCMVLKKILYAEFILTVYSVKKVVSKCSTVFQLLYLNSFRQWKMILQNAIIFW